MYPVVRAENREHVLIQKKCNEVEYLQFPKLSGIEQVNHLFSTRIGGVSKAHLSSMNLSYTRGDEPENVLENFRRIGEVLGCPVSQFVASHQTHTTNIRLVTGADAGKGVVCERDYADIDGLITDVPGLALVCSYADCVPLYFVDPVKNVIGLAHSGWRGTVACMGIRMVERMQQEYGCDPQDIVAAIGPSICRDCYEISEEVALQFMSGFWTEENVKKVCDEIKISGIYDNDKLLTPGKEPGKYQLDLWLANLIVLRSAGVRLENVDVTDVCTCCNPAYLYSHRASGGVRGALAAFLMLK